MAWVRTESPIVEGIVALKIALGPDQPDFYDVHYYGSAGDANSEFSQDEAIASPSALFAGETGMLTVPSSGQTEARPSRPRDCDERALVAASANQSAVTLTEEDVGPSRCGSGSTERTLQKGVTLSRSP